MAHPRPAPPPIHPWQCMWGCRRQANDMATLREHERVCDNKPTGWLTSNEGD
jgi:hypothetical protein